MEQPTKYRIIQLAPHAFVIEGYYPILTKRHKTFFGWKDLIIKDKWEVLSDGLQPQMDYMIIGKQIIEYTEQYATPWRKAYYQSAEEAEGHIEAKRNPFKPKEIKEIDNL